jgi:hypothetical protein
MATFRHLAVHPHRTRHGDSGGRLRPVPPLTTQQRAPSPAHRLSPPRMAEAGDVPKRWVAPTPAPLREKRPRRAEPESHPAVRTTPCGWRLGEYRHRSVGARAAPRAEETDDWNRRRCAGGEGPPGDRTRTRARHRTPEVGFPRTTPGQRFWSRTSKASRNASPMKLKATTVSTIARPAG